MEYTVDFESNWGGRTNETSGIRNGIPIILALFKRANIKGLFFISTEILTMERKIVEEIKKEGHEIGSHGHFHIPLSEWRAEQDRKISENFLLQYTGSKNIHYRAPKFHHLRNSGIYASNKNHFGLLKYMWFGGETKPILYLHPFDIVGGNNPPNLFCRLWYSQPRRALKTLENLCT
jgi:hypothetical protein